MLDLKFKISFTYLCWGIKESSLSEEYGMEISVEEGEAFTLKRQRASHFIAKDNALILRKKFGDEYFDSAKFPLALGGVTELEFSEDYEQSTDCITGVFRGNVRLK